MEEQDTQDQCQEPQKDYATIDKVVLSAYVKLFNLAAEDIWSQYMIGCDMNNIWSDKNSEYLLDDAKLADIWAGHLVRADKVVLQPSVVEPVIETAEQAYDRAMKIVGY